MTADRNGRFEEGSGRRNNDSSLDEAYPYGSSASSSSNSASAGTPMPTRIRPFESSMLYAACRSCTVETSASGEFEPSLVRKIGSRPSVAANRAWTCDGTIDQPSDAAWHEPQERPLVPSDWKNGLLVSTAPWTT